VSGLRRKRFRVFAKAVIRARLIRSRQLTSAPGVTRNTHGMDDDDRPPICPRCGVTMVPAALSADDKHGGDWVCLECEELDEDE
jgi:predicted lipoprotein with Yx(FWY)xxD motif